MSPPPDGKTTGAEPSSSRVAHTVFPENRVGGAARSTGTADQAPDTTTSPSLLDQAGSFLAAAYNELLAPQTAHAWSGSALLADGIRFYHTDHLGSVRVITKGDASIQEVIDYDPFGAIIMDTKSGFEQDRNKYTGQMFDYMTGLYYYGARYYDPETGRFTQADTIVPNPLEAQDFNRYTYANNNPFKFTDPSGHSSWMTQFSQGLLAGLFIAACALVGGGPFGAMVGCGLLSAYNAYQSGERDWNNLAGYFVGGFSAAVYSYAFCQVAGVATASILSTANLVNNMTRPSYWGEIFGQNSLSFAKDSKGTSANDVELKLVGELEDYDGPFVIVLKLGRWFFAKNKAEKAGRAIRRSANIFVSQAKDLVEFGARVAQGKVMAHKFGWFMDGTNPEEYKKNVIEFCTEYYDELRVIPPMSVQPEDSIIYRNGAGWTYFREMHVRIYNGYTVPQAQQSIDDHEYVPTPTPAGEATDANPND